MSSSSPQPPIPDLVFFLCCLTNFWYHQPPPLKSETWSLSPLLPISTALLQTCSLAHLAYGNTSQAQPYSSPIPSTSPNLKSASHTAARAVMASDISRSSPASRAQTQCPHIEDYCSAGSCWSHDLGPFSSLLSFIHSSLSPQGQAQWAAHLVCFRHGLWLQKCMKECKLLRSFPADWAAKSLL